MPSMFQITDDTELGIQKGDLHELYGLLTELEVGELLKSVRGR